MTPEDLELRRERAQPAFIEAARIFAANLMRVAAGAGNAKKLVWQLSDLYDAIAEYERMRDELPDQDWRYALSSHAAWIERPGTPNKEKLFVGRLDRLLGAALQTHASRLLKQAPQATLAHAGLVRRIDDYIASIE